MNDELDRFEEYLKKTPLKSGEKMLDSSIAQYIRFFNKYNSALSQVKTENLPRYMNAELNQKSSAPLYFFFRKYMTYLGVDEDHEIFNKIKKPRKRANSLTSQRFVQSKVLTPEELNKFFDGMRNPKFKCAISIFYDTAIRRSELMGDQWFEGLKFKHIIFMQGDKHKESRAKGRFAEVRIMGKGSKTRTVYFNKKTVLMILELHKGKIDPETKLISMVRGDGVPYKDEGKELYRYLDMESRRILGRNFHPHMLRHTKAQHMLDGGVPKDDVRSLLGHSDIRTTDIYAKNSSIQSKRAFSQHNINVGDL